MSSFQFDELLVNNSDYLKPFAFTLTRNNEAAKDLLQETLYKALANREKYHGGTNLRAWMYTIMRNIFINSYRKQSRQKVVHDNSDNDFLLNHAQSAVPNQAETNLGLKEIRAEFHKLPDIFRNPFQMYFEGYKYSEIAAHLGEPLGTVKSRIHFARRLLRQQINRY